jgi:hypothetical protein
MMTSLVDELKKAGIKHSSYDLDKNATSTLKENVMEGVSTTYSSE